MFRDRLHQLLHQRPFQPFRLHLTDGRTFEIRYPRINLLGQSFIDVGIPVPNDPDPVYEYTVIVPFSLIDRVEVMPEAGAPATP